MILWNTLLLHPLINILVAICRLTGDLGWSIVILTIGLRLVMTPLVTPGLRLSKKMQDMAPELNKLKEQYKDDKQGLLVAQTELYKKHGANPATGCLPSILQLLVLIALLNAFNTVLKPNGASISAHLNPVLYSFNRLPENFKLNTRFLYTEVGKPDTFKIPGIPFPIPGLFLIGAALVQLLSSKMMLPAVKKEALVTQKTESSTDDIMAGTQQQMLYMFPLMTLLFGFQFPTGLVIYWFLFSLIGMFQQYTVLGWGGLAPWLTRLNLIKSPR